MEKPLKTSYDEVPYESNPFPQTHPEHLATLAALFGMKPPPVASARVLELGCASGGNLIPHAVNYPDARFLGIDLSGRQVIQGQTTITALNLDNIELRHASITDVDEDYGQFDYIICHGVYSWVPDEVQQHILQVCCKNLSANGVAYVSYNTYPGWHMREMVRDMMRYHTGQLPDPGSQVTQARALLDFLSTNAPQTQDNAYGKLLKAELDLLSKQRNSYLFHEHLEEVNAPIYFHQLAERAAACGLQYLAESNFSAMLAGNFPAEVAETLRKIAPEIIRMEQYMDFLRNRQFRQTLLVHDDVPLKRNLGPEEVQQFHVATLAKKIDDDEKAENESTDEVSYKTAAGAQLVTRRPLFKSAMAVLQDCWPASIHFDELLERALSAIPVDESPANLKDQAATALGQDLLKAYSANIVAFSLAASPFATGPGQRPQTTALVRRQAEQGQRVTTLRHQSANVDDFGRHLLLLLNGKRDRAEIVDALTTQVMAGVFTLARDGTPVTDQTEIKGLLTEGVARLLTQFAHMGLLVA